jgi:hypothetical protein
MKDEIFQTASITLRTVAVRRWKRNLRCCAADARIRFGAIGAGTVQDVAVLMVDSLHAKAGVQLVPGGALVGMQHGAFGDALADRRHAT